MSISFNDLSEIAYGGAVTFTRWWDDKRIEEGKIASNEIWKKASFYTYLGIGLPSTLMSAFGWWNRFEPITERLSHGFLYDFPRFIFDVVQSMRTTSGRTKSKAVSEAERVLQERMRADRQLTQGRHLSRSYQPEFESVTPFAF